MKTAQSGSDLEDESPPSRRVFSDEGRPCLISPSPESYRDPRRAWDQRADRTANVDLKVDRQAEHVHAMSNAAAIGQPATNAGHRFTQHLLGDATTADLIRRPPARLGLPSAEATVASQSDTLSLSPESYRSPTRSKPLPRTPILNRHPDRRTRPSLVRRTRPPLRLQYLVDTPPARTRPTRPGSVRYGMQGHQVQHALRPYSPVRPTSDF